jgi:hypothetical protein
MYRFSVWLFILEKKQRHIFWFLSFSSGADIKPRDGGKKGRRHRELCCFNKLVHQKSLHYAILGLALKHDSVLSDYSPLLICGLA